MVFLTYAKVQNGVIALSFFEFHAGDGISRRFCNMRQPFLTLLVIDGSSQIPGSKWLGSLRLSLQKNCSYIS
jgi:hypothetical protein